LFDVTILYKSFCPNGLDVYKDLSSR
jgi:hypothetical protein